MLVVDTRIFHICTFGDKIRIFTVVLEGIHHIYHQLPCDGANNFSAVVTSLRHVYCIFKPNPMHSVTSANFHPHSADVCLLKMFLTSQAKLIMHFLTICLLKIIAIGQYFMLLI